ncbi:hypothetical protein BOVA514_1319 [Bacteroides ovatus]|nr:hypothetical protein BOVA514_1319 [Bacteroides ovatus]
MGSIIYHILFSYQEKEKRNIIKKQKQYSSFSLNPYISSLKI